MAVFTLTNPDIGSLYTIPSEDWAAIRERVELCLFAENIQTFIAQTLPDFPALVVVCKTWQSSTYPGLIEGATNLAQYSADAITSFTQLQDAIKDLKPNDPLPPPVKSMAEEAFGALDRTTAPLSSSFGTLSDQLIAFDTVNGVVDSQVGRYRAQLGDHWTSIAAENAAVEKATGKVLGAWLAISNDLDLVVRDPDMITTQFLLDLQIASAIRTWQQIQAEATAFASEQLPFATANAATNVAANAVA
jgi:hypothetical protein